MQSKYPAGRRRIVDLSGRITLGDGAGIVRETVKDMLKGGQKNLLLNLGDVSYIDSSCLGELVSAYELLSIDLDKL